MPIPSQRKSMDTMANVGKIRRRCIVAIGFASGVLNSGDPPTVWSTLRYSIRLANEQKVVEHELEQSVEGGSCNG